MRALLLALALSGGAAGCVTVSWTRTSRFAPVSEAQLAKLEAGGTSLTACLEQLGAPLWVWEHSEGGGDGGALAYGWFDEKAFGLSVSVPVSDYASADFDYDHVDGRMRGLVLFFDAQWVLSSFRTGLLRDLTREARRPPAALEEDA